MFYYDKDYIQPSFLSWTILISQGCRYNTLGLFVPNGLLCSLTTKIYMFQKHYEHNVFTLCSFLFLSSCLNDGGSDTLYREIELDCTESIRLPLYQGASQPSHTTLSDSQILSIGSLEDDIGTTFCTGTLIRRGWVISAGHCNIENLTWFRTGVNSGGEVRFKILRRFPIANHDVILFEISENNEDETGVLSFSPIELWTEHNSDVWLGNDATLVGFGYDENGKVGDRRFLQESITEVSETTIVVDGNGSSGACVGDSGGPLLFNDKDGPDKIIGVLSIGSSSCLGIDTYIRIDYLYDRIVSIIDNDSGSSCASVTYEGICSNTKNTVYCENGQLINEYCEEDLYCAFSNQVNAYRCISTDEDACAGITTKGSCIGNVASRCTRGTLLRKDCTACEQQCVVSPEGYPICD